MPQVVNSFYPALEIWKEIIKTLESDNFISNEIKNIRTAEVKVFKLPLNTITVNNATLPNSKALAVWFKTDIEHNIGNGLDESFYYFFLDALSLNESLDLAIENVYKLLTDCRYTIELNGNLSGLVSEMVFERMKPVQPPEKTSMWSYMARYEIKIRTDGIYLP